MKLTLRVWLFRIADDCLPAVVHMDVLDADNLVTVVRVSVEEPQLGLHKPSSDEPPPIRRPQLVALLRR
jgi:hypothetical protein